MMDAPLDTFRPSTLGWLRGTLAGWGILILAIAGIVVTLMGYGPYWLGLTAVALAVIIWKWLENMASKYEVTEERLVVRRGIISKSIDEIELYQLAGIGWITISSSDETTREGDLVLAGIERAQERRERLRDLVDTARQKRRVREIDMVHEDI